MLPNWYGIEGIGFEWRGPWNDPMLHYKGHVFNAHDMQDGLWESYIEDGGDPDNDNEWESYVVDNAVNYLEDIIFATESE